MCRQEAPPVASRAGLELADVLRRHAARLPSLSSEQARAARAIVRCRTAALGGHVRACDRCRHREVAYNSCRNRHCPKCQGASAAEWLAARERDLLPVAYYHVVFTLPKALHPFFRADPRRVYGLLFKAVSETLLEVARKRLGTEIGVTSVLHTWTQRLEFHPHIHCVATGGGLTPDGRWRACPEGFFLPEKVLSAVFRGKLLSVLERAVRRAEIALSMTRKAARRLLREATRTDWVVDARRPFAGPEQVLKYLSRYTHRIALTNARLVAQDDESVTFRWKDRREGDAKKLMTLPAEEFLRRFFQHVLPSGFVRIRHYGLLANAGKAEKIARCRLLLAAPPPPALEEEGWEDRLLRVTGRDVRRCPRCGERTLELVETLAPTIHASRGPAP